MLPLLQSLGKLSEFSELLSRLQQEKDTPAAVAVGGLLGVHKAHFAAAVRRLTGRPVLVITSDEAEAAKISGDMSVLAGEQTLILPTREFNFYNIEGASREWEHRRLSVLKALSEGKCGLAAATAEALMAKTMPPGELMSLSVTLEESMEISPATLTETLVRGGYSRAAQVEGSGQFSMRGGILDLFSPSEESPVRIEFFGDEIDTISFIDPATQRRTSRVKSFTLLPAAEILPGAAPDLLERMEKLLKAERGRRKNASAQLAENIERDMERLRDGLPFAVDRYASLIYPEMDTALSHLPKDTVVFISDHARVAERIKNHAWQYGEDMESLLKSGLVCGSIAKFYLDYGEFMARLAKHDLVFADTFISSGYSLPLSSLLTVIAKQLPSYGGSLETCISDVSHYIKTGTAVVISVSTEGRARRLHETLAENNIPAALDYNLKSLPSPGFAAICVGSTSAGFEYPSLGIAVITEGQFVLAQKKTRSAARDKKGRERILSYTDLSPGDLVVHEHHGIGRFQGIVTMEVDDVKRDYIKIAYSGSDSLYVPATQLDLVSKYIGAGEDTPVKLSKLGGTDWNRAKTRARAAVKDMARQLIALYSQRMKIKGFAFPPDSEWQKEFEESFEYEETSDQLRCVEEIKKDMCSDLPMDRLLCGDVGFGKTEVAFRAVMKCVLAGKQAAILVPTTVLAQQHYNTACRRFSGFPVNIEMMSRFRTPAQIKKAVKKLASGEADLVIGTHRLLQKDVKFKDLGLLIVDEEQRFGVAHKERLKELSKQVDVLTLSATPIPRTLNMALSSLRDMSTIEDPPRDRHPVQTYVLEHDWSVVADAMRRELARGGQVYYLHNRIDSIDRTVSRIAELLPDAVIGVGHGRMSEAELSDVMRRMSEGEIQILVCTTIIETGIDIPNVNTLIIEDADRMGLAQLHQIRGRVGRSNRHAYAYMTFRRGKALSEVQAKRLSAIREFAEFGSGFKIAMRDLEIRGAGNILGGEQHGHMLSVGYDMYLKLLEEAVIEEREGGKDRPGKRVTECTADLSVQALIPEWFVPFTEQRMDLYRRIAHIRDEADASDIIDEMVDRYGDVPPETGRLVSIALLRAWAVEAGVSEITQKKEHIFFTLGEFDFESISRLCSLPRFKRRLLFSAGDKPALTLRLEKGDDPLERAKELITAMNDILKEKKPEDDSQGLDRKE